MVTPKYQLGQKVKLNRLQKIVAEKMLWSKQNIPCFYLNIRADVTEMVALRARLNKTASVKVSFNDFIIKALAIGIKHYPILADSLPATISSWPIRLISGWRLRRMRGWWLLSSRTAAAKR